MRRDDLYHRQAAIADWLRPQSRGVATLLAELASIGTRPGLEKKANEDRVLCARFADDRGGGADAFVVCDGIGGLRDGDACAEVAISTFILGLAALIAEGLPLPLALREAISLANQRVSREFDGRGGSTLAAVVIHEHSIWVGSVGDTRAFLVRGGSVTQLTPDDTLRGALDAVGVIDADPSPEHRKLLQYIGMGDDLEPHIARVDANEASFVMICTDGAYGLPDPMFSLIARNAKSPRSLVERILVCADSIGMRDDSTIAAFAGPLVEHAPHDRLRPDMLHLWGAKESFAIWLGDGIARELRNRLVHPISSKPTYHMARDPIFRVDDQRVGDVLTVEEPGRKSSKKKKRQQALSLDPLNNGDSLVPVDDGKAVSEGPKGGKPSGTRY